MLGSSSAMHARRENGAWRATLLGPDGRSDVHARALVNAAGPWVCEVLDEVSDAPVKARVRHVKGSHIVVPRVHGEPHAYILQNADNRIVFIIPYLDRYSLIGTTDVPVEHYEHPTISEEETYYLLTLANTYLETPLTGADIVWTYSGVRPLYDDGTTDPSAVTRDYVLKVDTARNGAREARAPVLSVFGGKITTYRKLAEAALGELKPFLPHMTDDWTRDTVLPGGDLPGGDRAGWLAELERQFPKLPSHLLRGLANRYGRRATVVLDNASSREDLGADFGAGLTAREVDYLRSEEWAVSAEDILWRRTKCGLPMTPAERERVVAYVGR
jgi:glycerol-3-phosphate dehydrogenase